MKKRGRPSTPKLYGSIVFKLRTLVLDVFTHSFLTAEDWAGLLRPAFPDLPLSESVVQADLALRAKAPEENPSMDAARYVAYSLALGLLTVGNDSPLNEAIREAVGVLQTANPALLRAARKKLENFRHPFTWDKSIQEVYELEAKAEGRNERQFRTQKRSVLIVNGKEIDEGLLLAYHAPGYHRERLLTYIKAVKKAAIRRFRAKLRKHSRQLKDEFAGIVSEKLQKNTDPNHKGDERYSLPRALRSLSDAQKRYESTRLTIAVYSKPQFKTTQAILSPGESAALSLIGRGIGNLIEVDYEQVGAPSILPEEPAVIWPREGEEA